MRKSRKTSLYNFFSQQNCRKQHKRSLLPVILCIGVRKIFQTNYNPLRTVSKPLRKRRNMKFIMFPDKNSSESKPKNNRKNSKKCFVNWFVLFHWLDSATGPLSQHGPRKILKGTTWLLRKQRFSNIFASFSEVEVLEHPKFFGMVNYNVGWLYIRDEGPLGQWVTSEKTSNWITSLADDFFGKILCFHCYISQ